MDNEQAILESIVATWDINPEPEYRGFRCANCQNYINEAYYHWLKNDQFYIPVHFCKNCEQLYRDGRLNVDITQHKKTGRMGNFRSDYPGKANSNG